VSCHFITGASGFVGANLVRHLVLKGEEVHVLVRSKNPSWRLQDIWNKITIHVGDLSHHPSLKSALKESTPDYVYNLAVYGGHAAEKDSAKIREVNLIGVKNLLDAARAVEPQLFIQAGSSSEYGICQAPMEESMPLKPVSEYGKNKAEATYLCLDAAEKGDLPTTVLRLFSPMGSYDSADRLIPSIILSLLRGETPRVHSGKQVRDYIYIEDVVESFIQATNKSENALGQVFNIGSGIQQSIHDVTWAVIKAQKSPCSPEFIRANLAATESPIWMAKINAAAKGIGWKPRTSFENGLRNTIDWFSQNLHFYETKSIA
jgi:UDP-glucose 4-epimerase